MIERDPNELNFLTSLYKMTGKGKLNLGIWIHQLANDCGISQEYALEIATSLQGENLLRLSHRVAGDDHRLVNLTDTGKRLIISNSVPKKETDRIINLTNYGTMTDVSVSQDNFAHNDNYYPDITPQLLLEFVNLVRSERDTFPTDVQKVIVPMINEYNVESNKDKPDPKKLRKIATEIYHFAKPVASLGISQFVSSHLKSIFG